MQHQTLVVTHILDYAARWHGDQARPWPLMQAQQTRALHCCAPRNTIWRQLWYDCFAEATCAMRSTGDCHAVCGRRLAQEQLPRAQLPEPAMFTGLATPRYQVRHLLSDKQHARPLGFGHLVGVLGPACRSNGIVGTLAWNTQRHLEVCALDPLCFHPKPFVALCSGADPGCCCHSAGMESWDWAQFAIR